eukprot:UN17484
MLSFMVSKSFFVSSSLFNFDIYSFDCFSKALIFIFHSIHFDLRLSNQLYVPFLSFTLQYWVLSF